MTRVRAWAGRHVPGLVASVVVAIAARSLAAQYQAPAMLFALLLGMAMNVLADGGRCLPGIELASRSVLRIGVALLGVRITLAQIAALGWPPVVLVAIAVVATIGVSMLVARALGFNVLFGLLSGGATAICGASAALALAAALPAHPGKERATLFTVIGVSTLSTAAMIVYPMLARALGLAPVDTGIFLGGTIHDVAQVVGAGYGVSPAVGDTATVVKLVRVAMLLPVILVAVLLTRARGAAVDGPRPPLLPGFAVAFLALAALGSLGAIGPALQRAGSELSTWCLLTAIAALGMKTRFRELAAVGLKPVLLMLGETVFLAALVLALLRIGH
jgi:uncharacterized integral membrane protein (TIGR00698 family)